MKEYLYNKDFLPKSFIIAQNKKNNDIEKRDSILLTVIVCMLLPISIGNIKSNINEEKDVISYNDLEENIEDKSLYSWLDIVDMCFKGNFRNHEGNIYIYDKENLEEILQNENIVINTMEDLGENKYRVQIVQKENNK